MINWPKPGAAVTMTAVAAAAMGPDDIVNTLVIVYILYCNINIAPSHISTVMTMYSFRLFYFMI